MNKMGEVVELLGVSWNDGSSEYFEFKGDSYFITEKGSVSLHQGAHRGYHLADLVSNSHEIKKLPWKPKYGEQYWTVDFSKFENVDWTIYKNTGEAMQEIEKGLAFRTKKEAQNAAEIMLKSLEGLE